MKIKRIIVGELEENCYVLEIDGKALIIDPGDDFPRIEEKIGNLQVLKVLVTHHHFDHVGALSDCLVKYKTEFLDFSSIKEKEYQVGPFHFWVIETPGHTSDSISFYFPEEKAMFVGDFVFQGTIGRCDLPTGDFQEMKRSIQKLLVYSNEVILYPGHGDRTTISIEKKNNPYFT